jgi:hypothetical protein
VGDLLGAHPTGHGGGRRQRDGVGEPPVDERHHPVEVDQGVLKLVVPVGVVGVLAEGVGDRLLVQRPAGVQQPHELVRNRRRQRRGKRHARGPRWLVFFGAGSIDLPVWSATILGVVAWL